MSGHAGAADWVDIGPGDIRFDVGGLLPTRFESYVRILHPATAADGTPVRWDRVAAWAGRVPHALAQFHAIAVPTPGHGAEPPPWQAPPDTGTLTPPLRNRLFAVLAAHTGTAGDCWFCLWEGYAGMVAGDAPRVRRPARDYRLFHRPLAQGHFGHQSPNLAWPDDRAWCVATEVDLDSTYVGGSTALAEALLADQHIEAWPVRVDDPIDHGSDHLNT